MRGSVHAVLNGLEDEKEQTEGKLGVRISFLLFLLV